MSRKCAARNCLNKYETRKSNDGTTFHKIPMDEEVRQSWKSKLRINNEFESEYVCSNHFRNGDISKRNNRTYLRKGALPISDVEDLEILDDESLLSDSSLEEENTTIFDVPTISHQEEVVDLDDECSMNEETNTRNVNILPTVHQKDLVVKPQTSDTNMSGSPLTTHVLDTCRGRPAAGLPISLYKQSSGQWQQLAHGETNSDGRLPGLLTREQFQPGVYKLHFDTETYHSSQGSQGFYPYVEVVFRIIDPTQHYHVPLLLSAYGYSTYRGS